MPGENADRGRVGLRLVCAEGSLRTLVLVQSLGAGPSCRSMALVRCPSLSNRRAFPSAPGNKDPLSSPGNPDRSSELPYVPTFWAGLPRRRRVVQRDPVVGGAMWRVPRVSVSQETGLHHTRRSPNVGCDPIILVAALVWTPVTSAVVINGHSGFLNGSPPFPLQPEMAAPAHIILLVPLVKESLSASLLCRATAPLAGHAPSVHLAHATLARRPPD